VCKPPPPCLRSRSLASLMTWKTAVMGIPFGGAKVLHQPSRQPLGTTGTATPAACPAPHSRAAPGPLPVRPNHGCVVGLPAVTSAAPLWHVQGGITVDPTKLSQRELEKLTRKLVQVGSLLPWLESAPPGT